MILDASGLEIMTQTEAMSENGLNLVPGKIQENKDLILKFAMGDRYNQTPEPQLERGLEFLQHMWIAKSDGVTGGVIFLSYLDHIQWWCLDAYKNNEHDNREGDFSYRAGSMVIDWFFRNYRDPAYLHTIHRTDNRGATKVCERLGFEKKYTNPEFVILRIARGTWALKD